jgi:hypothetical protein
VHFNLDPPLLTRDNPSIVKCPPVCVVDLTCDWSDAIRAHCKFNNVLEFVFGKCRRGKLRVKRINQIGAQRRARCFCLVFALGSASSPMGGPVRVAVTST